MFPLADHEIYTTAEVLLWFGAAAIGSILVVAGFKLRESYEGYGPFLMILAGLALLIAFVLFGPETMIFF